MSRLAALVPAEVCAAALGRDWPDDLNSQVRCIDEGTRALGLAWCCAPWSQGTEDAALLAELGAQNPSAGSHSESLERRDEVAEGLARTPGAPPVLGLVSGPLGWSARLVARSAPGMDIDPDDAVEAASDLAATRIRTLAGRGVERVAVVEHIDDVSSLDANIAAGTHRPIRPAAVSDNRLNAETEAAADMHRPIRRATAPSGGRPESVEVAADLHRPIRRAAVSAAWVNAEPEVAADLHRPVRRAADHLGVEVVLVVTGRFGECVAPASLGYENWVSPDGGADGLALQPEAALESSEALARWMRSLAEPATVTEVVTAPLGPATCPDMLRSAAMLVANLGRGTEMPGGGRMLGGLR